MLLELQQAGKLEKWDTLLNHDSLADLVRGRIPTTLMWMLLKAYQAALFTPDIHGYPQASPADLRPQCLALHPLFTQMPFYPRMRLTLRRVENLGHRRDAYWRSRPAQRVTRTPKNRLVEWIVRKRPVGPSYVVSPSAATATASLPDTLQQLAAYLQTS